MPHERTPDLLGLFTSFSLLLFFTEGMGLSEHSSRPRSRGGGTVSVQPVGANQPEVVAAVQISSMLAKRLLPGWVHRSSLKGASKASDRATETPGAWCGSCGR